MKKYLIFIFIICPIILLGQKKHTSTEVVNPEKYLSPTKWSPKDKHFGYYIISFSIPVPIKSPAEVSYKSGYIRLGYAYRYKLADFMDIGIELAYANRYSRINKEALYDGITQPAIPFADDKMRTYHNYAEGGIFFRFNFGNATYRNLGTYIDIGALYDYAMNYGIFFKEKDKNMKQRTRIKRPDFLSPGNYGIYLRVGWNYLSFFCTYQFGDWISDNPINGINHDRSPLTLGIQLNLYAR